MSELNLKNIDYAESKNGSWQAVLKGSKVELLRMENKKVWDIVIMDRNEFNDLIDLMISIKPIK